MRNSLNSLVLFAIIALALADLNEDWANYKAKYDKNYDDAHEDDLRKEIYRLSVERIKEHNAAFAANERIYSVGIYHTTDLTDEEARRSRGFRYSPKPDLDWLAYKTNFKKSYDEKEEPLRHSIFHKKMAVIKKHNRRFAAGKVSWSMGVNQFTDLTAEEAHKYL